MLKQQMQRKMQGQKGFTLLELLVVVAIMAFIVAMVAPRFAGITGGTTDVVCDTNQQRMIAALSAYQEQKGSLPSGMVNLVDADGAAAFRVPTDTSDLANPDRGQATFFAEFVERNQFHVHHLDAAEADALKELGIRAVHNLNAYNYEGVTGVTQVTSVNQRSPLQQVPVASGLGVLMVGMGHDGTEWQGIATATGPGLIGVGGLAQAEVGWGNPEWFGRIILGVGPESDLIKQGMITAAGLCPGGVGNERVFWNNYSVLLPRLEATTKRYPAAMPTFLLGRSNGDVYRVFNIEEAQQSFMFTTQCPEGHRFPTPDELKAWSAWGYETLAGAETALAAPPALPQPPAP